VESGAPYAIVITASHNPAVFNGVKVKDSSGSSAGEELTRLIEREIPAEPSEAADLAEAERDGRLRVESFRPAHVERLSRMVDLDAIRRAGLKVVVDPMHGSSGRLLEEILSGGPTRVTTIHGTADPLFGGRHPEPLEANLATLRERVVSERAVAGFATDGDGDRIGAFDEEGRFVSPLRIAPLLALSLIRKGRRGPLGKTFANTILLDRIARKHGLEFSTFPVGFKYIASEMQQGRMLLGGEESGGIGIEGYIPERDGTLVSLMLLQALVDEGCALSELVDRMHREYGELHYRRHDTPCSAAAASRLIGGLREDPPASIGGLTVTGVDDRDGLKLLFGDEGWLLFRASGTEPVLRVYSEAPSVSSLDAVMTEAMDRVRDAEIESPLDSPDT